MSPRPATAGDPEVARLYQLPPGEFIAARNALASARKKGGDPAGAEQIRGLDKPSAAAWAVNQVWWHHRREMDALLEAGARLREAHAAGPSGASDLRTRVAERQAAVDAVVSLALDALGGPEATSALVRDRIVATCEALATSGVPTGQTLGQLSTELRSTGLEALLALAGSSAVGGTPARDAGPRPKPTLVARASAVTPASARKPSTEDRARLKADEAKRRHREELVAARAAVSRATAALAAADKTSRQAEAGRERAEAEARAALEQVHELEAAAERARDAERLARRAASDAGRSASEAEFSRAQAARQLERAEAALAALLEGR